MIKTRHGMFGTRIYRIWSHIKDRCNNPNCNSYKNYGARNIQVCKEWESFVPFYEWAINNGYRDDLTIDRIDSNEDYRPSNCRWITLEEQQRNKRNNHIITFNNETHCLSEWANIIGVKYKALHKRLYIDGWSVSRALTTPTRKRS